MSRTDGFKVGHKISQYNLEGLEAFYSSLFEEKWKSNMRILNNYDRRISDGLMQNENPEHYSTIFIEIESINGHIDKIKELGSMIVKNNQELYHGYMQL